MENKNRFYELLCKNSKDELEAFLIAEGKGPKAICPIVFDVSEEEPTNKEEIKNA
jgi:hypothetical protein